jgi:uncharacterized cupin superfamily protein
LDSEHLFHPQHEETTVTALLPEGKNDVVRGRDAEITLTPVPADDVVSGEPAQGTLSLGEIAGAALGIWELRGGGVTDTEVDEFFVVLSGGATIELLGGPGVEAGTVLNVSAGDTVRLVAGTKTRWTVEDHIRKVYISEA